MSEKTSVKSPAMNVIQKIEEEPLSFSDLKRMLGDRQRDTKLIDYNDLQGVGSLEEVFDGDKAIIVLLEIEAHNAPKVGHWIALLDQGDHFEHFDPYGLTADEEIAITHEEPWLSRLLAQADKRVTDSGTRFQAIREHVNTCGRWCVARVRLQDLSLQDFKKVIDQAHTVPDVTIALMTMFL